jgi:P4 family phage/plasmid primase-like protien
MSTDIVSPLITYTLFTDVGGATKTERADVPWIELVDKIERAQVYPEKSKCPLISLAEYGQALSEKGSLRHAKNVYRLFGVEVDYDGERISLQEGASRLRAAAINTCLYTSPSHRPDAPRWRVLLPLAEPALPANRATLVGRVNRILGGIASRESFTLSQSFYIGRVDGVVYETAVTCGRCVDEATELEPLFLMGHGDARASKRDLTTDTELRAAFERGEDRYQAMLKLSSRWAARGLEKDDIVAALEGLFHDRPSVNGYGIDLRERIAGIAESAVSKFGETRRHSELLLKASSAESPSGPGQRESAPVGSTEEFGLLSEDDLAARFTARYWDKFLFCEELGRWYLWTGTHWVYDNTRAVFDAARSSSRLDLAEALQAELTDTQRKALRTRLGSAATIASIIRLASADRRHAVRVSELDADPWLLNTSGGILDLKTGALRPHDPAQRMTKIAGVAPGSDCPHFVRALERSIPDPEVREFLQRLLGSCMTGVVRDHKVVVTYGLGANGKSVITNAIRKALGDYAVILASEVLMESHNDRHPTEIAVLRGARLALCSEVDSGRRWNEARLKRLSGGDPITARLIARDPFEFQPTHKFIVTTNAKPGLRTLDEATRRRILLVDFHVTIPEAERDLDLPEKLQAEAGGILRWMLIGCLEWQHGGLRPPSAVLTATAEYLDREDSIGEWIREKCRPEGQSSLSALHACYRAWAEETGVPTIGRNTFGDHLEARGLQKVEIRPRHWVFKGVSPVLAIGAREAI